jgi:hypothetical protein
VIFACLLYDDAQFIYCFSSEHVLSLPHFLKIHLSVYSVHCPCHLYSFNCKFTIIYSVCWSLPLWYFKKKYGTCRRNELWQQVARLLHAGGDIFWCVHQFYILYKHFHWCSVFFLRKWYLFSFVLPSCLVKHTNSTETTAVHTADSANRWNNNNSNHTLKSKMILVEWWLTCQNSWNLKRKVDPSQKVLQDPGNLSKVTRILQEQKQFKWQEK